MVRDDQIGDLYYQLNSLIRRSRALSNELHPELSLIAYTFLSLVQDTPEIQASDLAERLGLDKSTVSRQLNQLLDGGLLDRQGGRPGRRGDPLSLTAKGRRVLAADAARVRSQIADWIADWDTPEIAELASSIARFNASVEKSLGGRTLVGHERQGQFRLAISNHSTFSDLGRLRIAMSRRVQSAPPSGATTTTPSASSEAAALAS